MRLRTMIGVLALGLFLPSVSSAQQEAGAGRTRERSWELTVSASGILLDPKLHDQVLITDSGAGRVAVGGEVRLGYHLSRMWSLSIATAIGYASPALTLQPTAALSWTPDINARTSPFLTLGFGETRTSWDRFWASSRYGLHAGLGVRQMLGERLALRVEAREQYESYSNKGAFPNAVFNGTATVGISFFLGGGVSRDSDGDGVADSRDRCSRTPRGASVDEHGCPVDSDGDGVADGLDQCPSTPSGARIDEQGCPLDSDHDGVADYQDRCPDTPGGVSVDAAGCPADSDGDGVADAQDRCPGTPRGVAVDASGCPADSDGDGVADYLDRCPNTPQNTPVDAAGCPATPVQPPPQPQQPPVQPPPVEAAPPAAAPPAAAPPPSAPAPQGGAGLLLPAVGASLVLPGVTFGGQATLTLDAQAELDSVAAAMVSMPDARWQISSYWDGGELAARALRMSQVRALAVRSYLVSRGVPSTSLMPMAFGSQFPIADDNTEEGRARNRRIELKRTQ